MAEVRELVDGFLSKWTCSKNEDAGEFAKEFNSLSVENSVPMETCLPGQKSVPKWPKFNHFNAGKIELLEKVWAKLPWQYVTRGVSIAVIAQEGEAVLRLLFVEADTVFPQHMHPDATEVLELLHCGSNAKIGPTEDWTESVNVNDIQHYLPTAPKVIKAGGEPILALSGLKGKSQEIQWPDVNCGNFYGNSLMSFEGTSLNSIAGYYDNLAKNYDTAVAAWGYCLPEATVEDVIRFTGLGVNVSVLDLGCGNGLVGAALAKRGFTNITGADISRASLDIAENRGCYKSLHQADLLQPLSVFEDNTFDLLICVGTTSYLNPSVLEEWVRVVKGGGGVVCFTVKTSHWTAWESRLNQLENQVKCLTKIRDNHTLPYLPSLIDDGKPCKEEVKIYLYEKRRGS